MAIYPMRSVDAAWYHMDGPANLAMVTGIALTRKRLNFDRVRSVYEHRVLEFERFRQRVVERGFPIASPHWEDMPNFDINLHVHHVALPAPHDEAALTTLLDDIASSPLDRAQPLWQVHVVDNVEGGSALIMRYHHCIADGTAMMSVLERMADGAPEPAEQVGTGDERSDRGLLAPAFDAFGRAAGTAVAAAGFAVEALANPQQVIDKAAKVLEGAEMLVAELLKSPDPRSPLKGRFGMRKRVAWSKPVPLDEVKAIGAATGAKVNDVLVAAVTGALRSYLKSRAVEVDSTSVRAMVPVDLRRPERAGKLGNEFGLVVLDLPVATRRRIDRLAQTKARMDALKRSPEPAAIMALFNLFGRVPKAIEDAAIDLFGSRASVVMTNVAGPRATMNLAGVPIDRMMFWVPHPGQQLGMGISILSYRGHATLAIIADARLVPDPETITHEFNREVAAMLRQAPSDTANESVAAPPARKPRSKPKSKPRSEPKSKPRSEPRSKPRSEPRSKPRSEPESKTRSKPTARRRATAKA